jgi:hypothetical protein
VHTLLYKYLILNGQLSLPGLGTFHLQKTSSVLDFGNKVFTPPSYNFHLDGLHESPSKKLFGWLSKKLHVSDWDAIRMVNDFSFELKNKILTGESTWQNVGTLRRDEKGNIVLDSAIIQLESQKPVPAEKVLRVKAEHAVRVGEMEKTSAEMEEFFNVSEERKEYTWLIAIVITVLSIMFIGWYLSEKGVQPGSAGNQSIIQSK